MKKIAFVLINVLLFGVGTIKAQVQLLSDSEPISSGCLKRNNRSNGDEASSLPTIKLTKEGNILSVDLLNYESNCGTTGFDMESQMSSGNDDIPSVVISVVPVIPAEMDCYCPFNISYTVRDFDKNKFFLKCWWYEGEVTLEEGKPFVLEDSREDVVIDGMKYTLRKVMDRAMLIDGSTQKGEVHIPTELSYEGKIYSVTGISLSAFYNNKNLTNVIIPKTIKNMDLSNNIGINSNLFQGCTALQSIEVEEDNPAVCSVDGVLFNKEKSGLLSYPAGALQESYTVPESVTWIGGYAFSYSQHLKKVTLTDNVTALGYSAFCECQSLEEVRLSSGLKTLADYLFTNCQRLKSVTIPQNVTYLGMKAFCGCTSLASVTMPESVTSTDGSVFEGCTSLKSVTLSPNLERIVNFMFTNCSSLKEILIPNGVTMVGGQAFGNCSALTSLDLPESVTFLGSMIFAGCKLNTLYIRGLVDSYCMNSNTFRDMDTQTKLYVMPSEVEKYKAIYKGPVYSLPEAQDYSDYVPFVEMGKQWHVVRSDCNSGNYIVHHENYLLNGEVVKDGKTYLKMNRSEDDLTVVYDAGLLREENRKVYIYDADMKKEHMIFDYSLKVGDTYEAYSSDENKMVSYKVMSIDDCTECPGVRTFYYDENADSTVVSYRKLRQWTVCRTDNELLQKTWIEGVGSLEGPLGNLQDIVLPDLCKDYLAYVDNSSDGPYLPFSFYDTLNKQAHGCNLPTGEGDWSEDWHHHLTYELEGDRLHVYGKVFSNCANNYAYFIEKPTDDPLVHRIEFEIEAAEPAATCMTLHATDFYVPGFDPNLNYIIVDNLGEEHPVINKTPQNEYRPFVEEGKVWVVSGSAISADASLVHWTDCCYFEGDTIVGGQTCKLMKCVGNVNGPIAAWYEQDKKVYYAHYGNLPFLLAYDFTLSSNDTIDTFWYPLVVYKKSGGIPGFKGTYYEFWHDDQLESRWLEGVGSESWPYVNHPWMCDGAEGVLLACYVDDEVIYYNSEVEDPYDMGAQKRRFDFTHTTKIQPKTPKRRSEEPSLYGEYNDKLLGVNLDPVDDVYLVRITNETGKVVYEKAIDAGTIVALNIDISSYATGRYTVTVENSQETFTGEFETQATGIREVESGKRSELRDAIYNLQGQRLSSMQKGLNIVNGKKVYVR